MELLGREAARDVLLLSMAAGSADAVGYLSLGRVFTSNMTGNVVLLGIDLGQGHFIPAARDIFVLTVFILGLSLGAWLGRDVPEKKWQALAFRLIGLEKILLLIFGVAWFFSTKADGGAGTYGLLALLAMAMGLQSVAMYRLSAPGVGTTAVTGTLTALSSGIINHLFITNDVSQKANSLVRIRFQFGVLFLYAGGAALSGFCIMHNIRWVGFLPILAAAFVSYGRPRE